MPTYSYVCDGCEKSFEIEQRISEDPIKKCVFCGKAKAKRQIVSGNFILKGGGWYSDGYGSSSSGSKSSKPETVAKPDKSDSTSKPDKSESSTKSDSSSSTDSASKSSTTKATAAS